MAANFDERKFLLSCLYFTDTKPDFDKVAALMGTENTGKQLYKRHWNIMNKFKTEQPDVEEISIKGKGNEVNGTPKKKGGRPKKKVTDDGDGEGKVANPGRKRKRAKTTEQEEGGEKKESEEGSQAMKKDDESAEAEE